MKPSPLALLPPALLITALLMTDYCARAATPGELPPREIQAAARPALEEGRRALAAQDAAAVRAAVAKAVAALGPWAGNPETATRHFPPVNTAPFDAATLREWWLKEVARGRRGLPWRKNPTGDPRTMTAGLREAAWPLEGLARTALLFPDQREELTHEVRAGADWLLKLQHAGGGFPFPIGPGLNPREKVGHIVARAIKEHPEIVVDGWIPDDRDDGGLQFDNGLCGRALVAAWELTRDARYLDAARRAADWAAARPLVSNWNYNAFSVGLLARVAAATGDTKHLDAAVRKADAGVLPGQLPGGRWFDAHNACAVYHNILLRELLELFHALPADHAFRATLLDSLTRGLNQAAEETLAQGYTGTWTDNFARGLHWIGESAKWRAALHANLNAAGKNGAPTPGFAVIPVLELAQAGPAAPPAKPRATEPRVRRDVEYARVGEHPLKLDFYPATNATNGTQPAPLLIYVHGGAWRGGSKDKPPITALTEKGFALASVEYRLTTVAPFPANLHDIKAAVRFLRAHAAEFGCDPQRFVIVGSSAGGHLAALVGVSNGHAELEGEVGAQRGVSSDVQAIVSFYGAANLQTILAQSTPHGLSVRVPALQLLLGGQPDDKPALAKLASPVAQVDAHDPPLLLIHGDADPQMPIEQSRELLAAYRGAARPVELVVLRGSVHGGKEFYDAERLAIVETFLRRHLSARQPGH